MERKPLGIKSYGHIPHLPGSRVGPGDHMCHEGQKRIATERTRDKWDEIIVQEKLDGSNVGILRLGDAIIPLTRAGYVANTSPYIQHHLFFNWVMEKPERFMQVLGDSERLCGEWLAQAHGTRYNLAHEPLVVFDLMKESYRTPYDEFISRVGGLFTTPHLLHRGKSLSIEDAMKALNIYGFHGAVDPAEGCIWRVERDELIDKTKGGARKRKVDFLVKYVRPDKVDGCFLEAISGKEAVWNWQPLYHYHP